MNEHFLRRLFLLLAAAVPLPLSSRAAEPAAKFELAVFSADVTPPVGHPLLGGLREPAKKIVDPLSARGFVLVGGQRPVVFVSVDWCELRNDAYDRWREALAEAAGTSRERVLVTCIHQHDAPYADLTAQKILDQHGLAGASIDPVFHEETVRRVAAALRESLAKKRPITHLGLGEATVERIASNRRVELNGRVSFGRYSATKDPALQAADDGTIDPKLKTLSFWDRERAVAAVSFYATHPMSYYGNGEVSADFVGLARRARDESQTAGLQIYASGASGDVTAGKYNGGDQASRLALARRLEEAMATAWKATKRVPLQRVEFRSVPLKLAPRTAGDLAPEALEKLVADQAAGKSARIQAALGLSWQRRVAAGQPIDLPVVDFGPAQFLLLPAETFVAYQLAAQKMRPDSFVAVAGYGECAPGYTPTDEAEREGFVKEHGYSWVGPEIEEPIMRAMREALQAK
jgi:hypothetical protein